MNRPDIPTITLGADPEFELIVDGRVVSASSVLRTSVRMPWGSIGIDGGGSPLELRPHPSTDPRVLVKNVGRLILATPKVVGGVPSTMSEMYAIGGHVHIGFEPLADMETLKDVVRNVDDLLGDIFFSMNSATRVASDYGKRLDWRYQPHGVEYRTPPASAWAHPEAALVFAKAIRWVTAVVVNGEKPSASERWSLVRSAAERAADLVMRYDGRIHWEAWKAYVGEDEVKDAVEIASAMNCEVRVGVPLNSAPEYDAGFIGDIGTMLARLGIRKVVVVVFPKSRGDYASNVRGYGNMQHDHGQYRGEEGEWAQPLMLSWRFCNDPAFRRGELPKLETAIAALLGRKASENADGGRLVKNIIRLQIDLPDLDDDVGADAGGGQNGDAPEYIRCVYCEREAPPSYIIYSREGEPYCLICHDRVYTWCTACGREEYRDFASYDEGGRPYCDDCYYETYAVCSRCDTEMAREEAIEIDGYTYCERCFNRLYTTARCSEYVPIGNPSPIVVVSRTCEGRYTSFTYVRGAGGG